MSRERRTGRTKDHLYTVFNTFSLRWAGIRGGCAFVEVATYDVPRVTIRGEKRGEIVFPVADIRRMRVGPEFDRGGAGHHCVIWRRGARTINLGQRSVSRDHRALVLHLAEEMAGLDRFDRVQRGLRIWMGLAHVLIFGGTGGLILGGVYDSWLRWGEDWGSTDIVIASGLTMAGLWLIGFSLFYWFRWYRPRRVRDMDDLAAVLP